MTPALYTTTTSHCARSALAAVLLMVLPTAVLGQEGDSTTRVCGGIRTEFSPASPRAGTMFRVRVLLASPDVDAKAPAVSGDVAGEALHFTQRGDTLESLAAMPVDSVNGATLSLACGHAAGVAQAVHTERIKATDGAYRLEKLSVAPRFGAAPDSAVAQRMRREAERSAAVSQASHSTPRMWTSAFLAPRESRVTSGFGNGRTFNGQITSRHTGTDYAGAIGTPVRAINRGVVRIVDAFYLGGNVIYVDHGAGIVSAYLHLSRHEVAVGDTVARGQVIGRVGATGRVTGPHLHLITRYGAISVDAMSVIGKR